MKWANTNKSLLAILTGFIIWIAFLFLQWPSSLFHLSYVEILILAAPLWLIPLIWQVETIPKTLRPLILPTSVCLAIAFLYPTGTIAALWATPWLLFTGSLALVQCYQYFMKRKSSSKDRCLLMAFVYLPIGASWAFANRLDFHPLGFDPTIGLLTVAHFHYAGFALPVMTGLIMQHFHQRIHRLLAIGVLLGVPLVATGITTTHLHLPVWIEVFAVTVMALSAFGIGCLHLALAWRYRGHFYALLWGFAGLALISGMVLAFLYGWRHYFPIPALNIPLMYAIHGTLNALGFALPGLLGWYLYKKKWSGVGAPLI